MIQSQPSPSQLRPLVVGLLLAVGGSLALLLPKVTVAHVSSPVMLERANASAQLVSQSSDLAALERAVHEQINQYRTNQGLPPLTLDNRISEQSRLHSQAMASGRVPFSHQGFKQRVQIIARSIPYRGAAENVAKNRGFAQPDRQAVQGWLNSPGHLANIRGNYNVTGIGVAVNSKGEYYFTQIFIQRR